MKPELKAVYSFIIPMVLFLATESAVVAALIPQFYWYIFPLILLTAVPFLYGAAVVVWKSFTEEYEIGDSVVIRRGLVNRTETSIEYQNIASVSVVSPFWLRAFGFGNVSIRTNDGGTSTMFFLSQPWSVPGEIEKKKSGLLRSSTQ